MRPFHLLPIGVALVFGALPAAAQTNRDEALSWCKGLDGATPDRIIAGCTWLIRSGQEDRQSIALAFERRGGARRTVNDPDGAATDLDEAIRLDPAAASAFGQRGLLRESRRDFAGAAADFLEASRLDPAQLTLLIARARGQVTRAMVRDGRPAEEAYQAALAYLTPAIERDPNNAALVLERAHAHREMRQPGPAEADYRAAIELDPSAAEAFAGRAVVRYQAASFGGAAADYTEALRLAPEHRDALAWTIQRGRARLASGDPANARADFDAALRLAPRDADILADRCVARFRAGERQQALTDCAAAITAAGPSSGGAHAVRAGLRLLQNDLNGAGADLTEALRREPRNAAALWLRAELRWRQRNVQAGAADRSASLAIDPDIGVELARLFGPGLSR